MFKLISNLFNLLSSNQRRRFYILQLLVILMTIVEILGVASIIPFMALVGDMTQLQQDTFIAKFYQMSGINSESQFVFILGICVLIMLFISMIISIFTIWGLSMFANKIGTEIADRLYEHYLNQDWLFHASGSSAQLTKKIATETMRVTGAVLVPLMQLNSKIILSLLMSISIFVYDPKVAAIGLSIFAISYFFLFKGVRNRLNKNGIAISEVNEERFRLMNEGFGGIKDVLLMGRDNDFINRFNKSGKTLAYSQGTNTALAQAPRYFVELLAFGSMISLILYLIASHNGNLGMILPIISVYAIGTIKLLPELKARGINKILVEGGETVMWSFLEKKIFSKLYIFTSNIVIGGTETPTIAGGNGSRDTTNILKLEVKNAEIMGSGVLVEYAQEK